MLDFIRRFRSVVENTYEYENVKELIKSIKENVVEPAEAKVKSCAEVNSISGAVAAIAYSSLRWARITSDDP